eukprot:1098690-Pelagomonas_calceolata.AAC.4
MSNTQTFTRHAGMHELYTLIHTSPEPRVRFSLCCYSPADIQDLEGVQEVIPAPGHGDDLSATPQRCIK